MSSVMPLLVFLFWILTLCVFDVEARFRSKAGRTLHIRLPGWGSVVYRLIKGGKK